MYIRMLTGRYAGELRDVREEEAKAMLLSGQALDPYKEPLIVTSPAPVVIADTPILKPRFKAKAKR